MKSVELNEIALVLRWLIGFWLLGWLVFPFSRRLFRFLPDSGLAAGRLLALVGVSLLGFWLASLRVMPLSFAVFCAFALPLFIAYLGWPGLDWRALWRENGRAFLISDAVFLIAFGFFLWIRLRHPAMSDLEKPMDAMLLSGVARANLLPFENPWLAGNGFTNYYYFGPTMGALSLRALATPVWQAYNLIQPLFCAFFLSVLWSLGSALTHSKRLGVLVALLVGLGGHLEPLRQFSNGKTLMTLDWWKTSRVFDVTADGQERTINEYPAFTMLIGDLHAHFYALALAVLHFSFCFGILATDSQRVRRVLTACGGVMLAVFALGNTWDLPLYGILWALSIFIVWKREEPSKSDFWTLALVLLAIPIVAAPYFWKFRSPVSGAHFQLWMPDVRGFLLFWGVWIVLGILAFVLSKPDEAEKSAATFRRLLMILGAIAVCAPFVFYLGGAWEKGDLAHQDTVFKFWLQGWLLFGTAVACEFLNCARIWWRDSRSRPAFLLFGALLTPILALAPFTVARARTFLYGGPPLSLNGMRHLPQSDQKAVEWLSGQSGTLVEGLKVDENGQIGGDYDALCGRFSGLSGNPTVLGWPGHIGQWGDKIGPRPGEVLEVYRGSNQARREILTRYGVRWVMLGDFERALKPVDFGADFGVQEFKGVDGSSTLVFERKGF